MKIAFGCQARVGKDIACKYLQTKHGGVVLHFSDALYNILHFAQETCRFSIEKDVQFLQWVGMWARSKNPAVWINTLLGNVPKDDNVYIGDLRFRNEFQALKDAGFTCIRIIRDDRPIDRDPNHASEIELLNYDSWDYTIINNGTLQEFYDQLDQISDLNQSLRYSNEYKENV